MGDVGQAAVQVGAKGDSARPQTGLARIRGQSKALLTWFSRPHIKPSVCAALNARPVPGAYGLGQSRTGEWIP